ncbi:MAG: hypothetical protein WA183_15495 [Chthoniobacterales bacterium]
MPIETRLFFMTSLAIKNRSHAVHRMFYNSMRWSGVNVFGAVAKQQLAAEGLSTSDIAQISEWIERNNPDLGAIESHPVKSMAARGN